MKNLLVLSLIACILLVFGFALGGCSSPFVFDTYLQKSEWVQPKLLQPFELRDGETTLGTLTWGKLLKARNATFKMPESEVEFVYDTRKYSAKVIDVKTQTEWATLTRLDRSKATMTLKDGKTFNLALYLSKAELKENTTQVLAMNALSSRNATMFVLQ